MSFVPNQGQPFGQPQFQQPQQPQPFQAPAQQFQQPQQGGINLFDKEQRRSYFKKTFTLEGRLSFPELFEAKSSDPTKAPTFSTMFIWDKGQNAQVLNEIKQFCDFASMQLHNGINPAAMVNPFKDYDTHIRNDGKPNPDHLRGKMWLNASSGRDYPVRVLKNVEGVGLITVTNPAEVYSGQNAAISIELYSMGDQPRKDGKPSKRGYGINLVAVLLLPGGEPFKPQQEIDPQASFGNFLQQTHSANAQVPQQNNPFAGQQPQQQAPAQQYQQPQYPQQYEGNGYAPQGTQQQYGQVGMQGNGSQHPGHNGTTAQPNAYPSNGQNPFGQQTQQQQPQQFNPNVNPFGQQY